MKLFRIVGCLAVVFLAISPTACSRPGGGGPSRSASDKPRVAFISNNDYEFWRIAQRGTEKAAGECGVEVEFKMPPGGGTPAAQRQFIEDLLVKGVKGIAISPNDAANQAVF